jgi:hypothetical protein
MAGKKYFAGTQDEGTGTGDGGRGPLWQDRISVAARKNRIRTAAVAPQAATMTAGVIPRKSINPKQFRHYTGRGKKPMGNVSFIFKLPWFLGTDGTPLREKCPSNEKIRTYAYCKTF